LVIGRLALVPADKKDEGQQATNGYGDDEQHNFHA